MPIGKELCPGALWALRTDSGCDHSQGPLSVGRSLSQDMTASLDGGHCWGESLVSSCSIESCMRYAGISRAQRRLTHPKVNSHHCRLPHHLRALHVHCFDAWPQGEKALALPLERSIMEFCSTWRFPIQASQLWAYTKQGHSHWAVFKAWS